MFDFNNTKTSFEVYEHVLAHKLPDEVEAAYLQSLYEKA